MFETEAPISYHKIHTPESFIPGIAAHLVDVDPENGKVDTRYTIFQDVGEAVHPDYVKGQMQGSAIQGIDMTLWRYVSPTPV